MIPALCYTSWDGRLQYGLVMPKGGLKDFRGKYWVSLAVRSAPAWLAEHVLARWDEIEGPTRLNMLVGRAPRWTLPGCCSSATPRTP